MLETLALSEKEAVEAICRRWRSSKHVQDMVELLAKQGAHPLDPEVREAARLKALETKDNTPSSKLG